MGDISGRKQRERRQQWRFGQQQRRRAGWQRSDRRKRWRFGRRWGRRASWQRSERRKRWRFGKQRRRRRASWRRSEQRRRNRWFRGHGRQQQRRNGRQQRHRADGCRSLCAEWWNLCRRHMRHRLQRCRRLRIRGHLPIPHLVPDYLRARWMCRGGGLQQGSRLRRRVHRIRVVRGLDQLRGHFVCGELRRKQCLQQRGVQRRGQVPDHLWRRRRLRL